MIAWHCDGPGCEAWQQVHAWPDTWTDNQTWIGLPYRNLHFCSWACCQNYAASKAPSEEVRR